SASLLDLVSPRFPKLEIVINSDIRGAYAPRKVARVGVPQRRRKVGPPENQTMAVGTGGGRCRSARHHGLARRNRPTVVGCGCCCWVLPCVYAAGFCFR